jgi:hypothetical protein
MMDLELERAPLLRIRRSKTRFACGQRSAWFPFRARSSYHVTSRRSEPISLYCSV